MKKELSFSDFVKKVDAKVDKHIKPGFTNRNELVDKLAKRPVFKGMSKKQIYAAVSDTLSAQGQLQVVNQNFVAKTLKAGLAVIKDVVKQGFKLNLFRFGVFSRVHRAARKGVNPQTRKPLKVDAHDSAHFQVSSSFKKDLNN